MLPGFIAVEFKRLADYIAFCVEVIAALIIAYGAVEALIGLISSARLWTRIGVYSGGRHRAKSDLADLAADRAIGRNRA